MNNLSLGKKDTFCPHPFEKPRSQNPTPLHVFEVVSGFLENMSTFLHNVSGLFEFFLMFGCVFSYRAPRKKEQQMFNGVDSNELYRFSTLKSDAENPCQ